MSRCSIGPAGQFTIGANNSTLLHSSLQSASPSLFHSNDVSSIGKQDREAGKNQRELSPQFEVKEPEKSPEEPTVDAIPSVFEEADELSDFDLPSQKAASRRNSLAANVWKMEDPYDDRQNRSAPYKRGQNSLNKAEIEKRLNREKEQRRATQKMVETKDESLFLYPSKGLSIFK